MANDFERILDECIDRINRGEGLEACLADYPKHAQTLQPLLHAVLQTQEAYSFVPSAAAKREARLRFNAARARLEQKRWEKQPLFARVFARPVAWATVAVAIAILLVSYFSFQPAVYPITPVPSPEGNFVFLISDDVNAIADFQSLNVSIAKIGLQLGGDSDQWVEFVPEVKEVDLTQLQGDKAQEIWQGNVPEGQYTKVFIEVTSVRGVLKQTGQVVEVKLPSGKLRGKLDISEPFQVTADTVTSFTYDLTVVAAGSPKHGVKYILKPQIGESGASQKPSVPREKGKSSDTRQK